MFITCQSFIVSLARNIVKSRDMPPLCTSSSDEIPESIVDTACIDVIVTTEYCAPNVVNLFFYQARVVASRCIAGLRQTVGRGGYCTKNFILLRSICPIMKLYIHRIHNYEFCSSWVCDVLGFGVLPGRGGKYPERTLATSTKARKPHENP